MDGDMAHLSIHTTLTAVGLAVLLVAGPIRPAGAQSAPLEANESVGAGLAPAVDSGQAAVEGGAALRAVGDEDGAALRTANGGSESRPTSSEAAPLGQPNGLLSARPADRESKRGLTALDPRSNEITRVLGALAVVLGLLFGLRAVVRRSRWALASGGRPSGVVEILARYPVARGQHLILLKLARRVLLVHRSGSTMTTLSEVSDPDEVAALLGRIEAGSRRGEHRGGGEGSGGSGGSGGGGGNGENGGGRFGQALQRSGAEHDRLADGVMRLKGRRSGFAGTEVIDLTRRRKGAGV